MTSLPLGKTGVYRLFDSSGRLLYVGIGSEPESRFKDHERDKPWWPDVASNSIAWHDTRDGALAEEFAAIRDESPLHNKAAWEPKPATAAASVGAALRVPVAVMRKHLGRRIDAANFLSEPTIIEKNGEPRAVLVPFEWWEAHKPADSTDS